MAFVVTSNVLEICSGRSWCEGRTASGEEVTILVINDENVLKGLLKYRHPCILQYVGHRRESLRHFIAVESSVPLRREQILRLHPVLKIAGLWSLLQSLEFLHIRANTSLADLGLQDVFVAKSGKWKLLPSVRVQSDAGSRKEDIAKFFSLAEEILQDHFSDYPEAEDFLGLAADLDLSFSQLQAHPLFARNTFVNLLESLHMLPMKTCEEKQSLFREMARSLHSLADEVWSQELLGLLCSRLVFIDATARRFLLPHLLTPRPGGKSEWTEGAINPLVPISAFKRLCVPLLETAFKVKDFSVRMALLENLARYLGALPEPTLRNRILPEILCGVRDVSDTIVSMSLRSLSLLVPVLGASAVVGPNREKIFTDGRPKVDNMSPKNVEATFPARSSPDGGETFAEPSFVNDDKEPPGEEWSDWDRSASPVEDPQPGFSPLPNPVESEAAPSKSTVDRSRPETPSTPLDTHNRDPIPKTESARQTPAKKVEPLPLMNELSLDIKTIEWKGGGASEIEDFFKDMEPNYQVKMPQADEVMADLLEMQKQEKQPADKLAMAVTDADDDDAEGAGWEQEETGDWNWEDE